MVRHMTEFAHYPSLENAVIFLTGGASGIGEVMVRAFARQGAKVGFLDIDETGSQKLAAELREQGADVAYEICDLRNIEALQFSLTALASRLGDCSVLINSAANDDRHDWQDVTPDYYDERISVNLRHMFFAIQAVAPAMIKANKGSIINISSNSWWEAVGGMPVYTTAKSAIHGMTRSFARDLGHHHIRVNTVVPGWIMTQRQKDLWVTEEKLKAHLQNQCLPDAIDPIYVANMVLFLASDDAAMCSAQNFFVEGGSV